MLEALISELNEIRPIKFGRVAIAADLAGLRQSLEQMGEDLRCAGDRARRFASILASPAFHDRLLDARYGEFCDDLLAAKKRRGIRP